MSTDLLTAAAPVDPLDLTPQPGAGGGSRRTAARMAARDLRRHPWRTLLVLALIGLPVFAAALGSTLLASTAQPTAAEERHRLLWGFDGRISEGWFDPGVLQSPADPGRFLAPSDDDPAYALALEHLGPAPEVALCPAAEAVGVAAPEAGALCGVAESVPAGAEAVLVTEAQADLTVPGSAVDASAVVADLGRGDLSGPERRFVLLDGSLPGSGEAAASPALRQELAAAAQRAEARGLEPVPQDEVTVEMPDGGSVTVGLSGTVLDREDQWPSTMDLFRAEPWSEPALYLPPDSPAAALGQDGEVTAYLSGEVPADYDAYRPYNEAGLAVLFAPVMDGSGALQEIFDEQWGDETAWLQWLPLLFVGVLALAEAGLLAGAAFAVGARQQRRSTALLSVTGAEPATLRQTMVFSGLWCGLLAAGLAILAGVGAAVVVLLSAQARNLVVFGPHVPWGFVIGAGALGVVCAVVAAWVPARAVSRQDAWAAIKGASGERRPVSRRMLVSGVACTGLGLLATAGATVHGMAIPTLGGLWNALGAIAYTLIGGAILLLVGLLLLIPGAIAAMARVAGRLPVPLRMAARDAHRNRSRAVPVTAAVLSATAVGAALLTTTALVGSQTGSHRVGSPTPDTAYVWVTDQAGIAGQVNLDRHYGPDGEATAESLGLYTGGAAGATALLDQARGLAGAPQMVGNWRLHAPASTCATPYMADCTELVPVYPASSVCHVPVPDQPTMTGRYAAVDEAVQGMSRADGAACGISGIGYSAYLDADPLATLLVVDPDRPTTVPSPLFPDLPGALEALAAGQAIVFDEQYLAEGTVTLGEFSMDPGGVPGMTADLPTDSLESGQSALQGRHPMWAPERTLTLDAVAATPPDGDHPLVVIPASVLEGTDQQMRLHGVLAQFTEPVSTEQGQLVNDVLRAEQLYLQYRSEDDSAEVMVWAVTGLTALLVLTVAGMTTGLALADARRDQAVLASVGANPGTRKSMAAAQAFSGTLVGTVLGIPVGASAVVGLGMVQSYSVDWVPWLPLAVLALGAPVLAAGLTWLVVPGRLPARQRDRD